MADQGETPVLVQRRAGLLALVLNRPQVLNTLNLEMIRLLRLALNEALGDDRVRLVLIGGAGEKGFCAGGDLKELARAVREGDPARDHRVFREEYALDLLVHRFPKAVVVLAHGVTMGGGLGLAAGADLVVATERTRMAMPETRIGFFPDVGATGWLFFEFGPGWRLLPNRRSPLAPSWTPGWPNILPARHPLRRSWTPCIPAAWKCRNARRSAAAWGSARPPPWP